MNSLCSHERLKLALAGRLDANEESMLQLHLDDCEHCSAELERLSGGEQASREIASMLISDELDEALPLRDDCSTADFVVDHLEPSDSPESLGTLGGYDILEIIGRGGMGIVLKGYDRELKRFVAIKALAPHLAHSALARKRFAREAQAAAAVVNLHVIAIHHVQSNGKLPFLVMPLLTGESLAKRLKAEGAMELKEVLRVGMQAAEGLAAAHAQGLIHRDVKPANILLEKGVERAVLTDFGLARAADDVSMTRMGIIAGTPEYMSPEQARGEALDGRSDLFSLGCVLYEMATGVSPFRTDSSLASLRRIVDEQPTAMTSLAPELPPWFCQVVERLLSKEPAQRFASAAEVKQVLEECLSHLQQPTSVPLPASLSPHSTDRSSMLNISRKGVIAMTTTLSVLFSWFLIMQLAGTPDQPAAQDNADSRQSLPLQSQLQGKWRLIAWSGCDRRGQMEYVPDPSNDRREIVFHENELELKIWGEDSGRLKFTLDTSSSPAAIDITSDGQKIPGLIELNDGTLRLGLDIGSDPERPKKLDAKPGVDYYEFRRSGDLKKSLSVPAADQSRGNATTTPVAPEPATPQPVSPKPAGADAGKRVEIELPDWAKETNPPITILDGIWEVVEVSTAGQVVMSPGAQVQIEKGTWLGFDPHENIDNETRNTRCAIVIGPNNEFHRIETKTKHRYHQPGRYLLQGDRLWLAVQQCQLPSEAPARAIPTVIEENVTYYQLKRRGGKSDPAMRPAADVTNTAFASRPSLEVITRAYNAQTARLRRELFQPPIPDLTIDQMKAGLKQAAEVQTREGRPKTAQVLQDLADKGTLPQRIGGLVGYGTHEMDENGETVSRLIVPTFVIAAGDVVKFNGQFDESTEDAIVLTSLSLLYSKDGYVSKQYEEPAAISNHTIDRKTNQ